MAVSVTGPRAVNELGSPVIQGSNVASVTKSLFISYSQSLILDMHYMSEIKFRPYF